MADDDFDLDAMLEDAAGEVFSEGVDVDSLLDEAADEVISKVPATMGPPPLDARTEAKVGGS